ncbi:MAG: cbb3-type cytochrome c oxidase subunit II [Leptospirales bacterium]|nr:cbb3-type cytochrome c oxidase subunit II [Leptospirales bacterium]
MSALYENILARVAACFQNPQRLAIALLAASLFAITAVVWLPFRRNALPSHGSMANLHPPSQLEIAGQQVYFEEGCQYCHTQALRPIAWEALRMANAESYGYFLAPDMMEYYYESPAMRGSVRIGPDLARLSGRMDESQLRGLLQSKKSDTPRAVFHRFGHLFQTDDGLDPLGLSWRTRMQMNAGSPISDPQQRSAFTQLADQTRGDALVAYLLSLGKRQRESAGKFYATN